MYYYVCPCVLCAADIGIPEFWLNAFMANEKVAPYITERDMEVLKHLVDVRTKTLTGEDKGFEVAFVFEKNDYFSNQVRGWAGFKISSSSAS